MNWFWYGLFYSFAGFLLEVAYTRLIGAQKRARKCLLLLPLCPVYGLGAVAILLLPEWVQGNPVLLFSGAALAATAAEYAMSVFYECCWGVSFWDYSRYPGNLRGRVCLWYSLCWGALGLGLVSLLHPAVAALAARIPDALFLPAAILTAADFTATGRLLRRTGTTESLAWYRRFSKQNGL